jgi:hypothetical protein
VVDARLAGIFLRVDEATSEKGIEVGRKDVDELMSWLDWPAAWSNADLLATTGPGYISLINNSSTFLTRRLPVTDAHGGEQETCYLPSWPPLGGDDPYDMTPRGVSSRDVVRP